MDSYKVIKDLNQKNLSGVQFYQKTFKPKSIKGVAEFPKYQGELCYGIKINILDKSKVIPLDIAVVILKTIYKHHSDKFSFNNNNFIEKLYGSKVIKSNITNQESIFILFEEWKKSVKDFKVIRKHYLLYWLDSYFFPIVTDCKTPLFIHFNYIFYVKGIKGF